VGSSKPNSKKPAAKAASPRPVAAKPAPKKASAPVKKPAAKAAPAKPAPAAKKPAAKAAPAKVAPPAKVGKAAPVQLVLGPRGGALGKAAPPAKKKAEPIAKATAPAKSKKDEKLDKLEKAAAPAAAKGGPVKAVAAPAKPPAAAKAVKPPKPPKPPPAPKVPRVKKTPVVLGPMEKAQRSLAATAARAAAKDKVPPTKALAAFKEAQAKAAAKIYPTAAIEAKAAAAAASSPKKSSKVFFHEVQPGAERIIKRGDKTTATPIPADVQNRRRGGGGEESPEELVERIERELENQHIFKRNMLRPQLCTKCGINQVSERFTIDKELGYCDDCAEILHLGETKEARKIDFHPSLMKKDGEPAAGPEAEEEDEAEDPPAGPVPEID